MRALLILIVFIIPVCMQSQSRDNRSAPFTVRYNVGIQKSISSQKFRTAFNGVFETNLSVNARVFGTYFVGLGYQYTHFQNNKAVFGTYQPIDPITGSPKGVVLTYNTRLIGNAPFFKIGYDHFFEKGFATYALNAGYSLMHYKNLVNDSADANQPFVSTKFNAGYVQPEISVSFIADRSLTFSIIISYTTMFYKFDPKAPRFNAIDQVRQGSNNYFMSWINIGFGVTVLMGKR